jgi:hypothetical protein
MKIILLTVNVLVKSWNFYSALQVLVHMVHQKIMLLQKGEYNKNSILK